MTTFNLPPKWCIKMNNEEVVQYCNKWGQQPPYNICRSYAHFPPFDLKCTSAYSVKPSYEEITLEQFKEFVLNEKPQPLYTIEDLREGKCCLLNDGTPEELRIVLQLAYPLSSQIYWSSSPNKSISKYFWADENYFWKNNLIGTNLPSQTVKEFLKQMNNKAEFPIGYKLKEEFKHCEEAALKIIGISGFGMFKNYDFHYDSEVYELFNTLGLIDLWFEPVFKIKLELPTINNYSGVKVDSSTVMYGCATFKIAKLQSLYNNFELSDNRFIKAIELNSGVTITMDQIKSILDYFNQ